MNDIEYNWSVIHPNGDGYEYTFMPLFTDFTWVLNKGVRDYTGIRHAPDKFPESLTYIGEKSLDRLKAEIEAIPGVSSVEYVQASLPTLPIDLHVLGGDNDVVMKLFHYIPPDNEYIHIHHNSDYIPQLPDTVLIPPVPVSITTTPAQGKRYNSGKVKLGLYPPEAVISGARGFTYGESKYDAWNWLKGLEFSGLIDCLERHLAKFKAGIDIDDESKLHHIDLITCNVSMLATFIAQGRTDLDDRRPFKPGYELNTMMPKETLGIMTELEAKKNK